MPRLFPWASPDGFNDVRATRVRVASDPAVVGTLSVTPVRLGSSSVLVEAGTPWLAFLYAEGRVSDASNLPELHLLDDLDTELGSAAAVGDPTNTWVPCVRLAVIGSVATRDMALSLACASELDTDQAQFRNRTLTVVTFG